MHDTKWSANLTKNDLTCFSEIPYGSLHVHSGKDLHEIIDVLGGENVVVVL